MELFRILEELGRKKIWVFLALLAAPTAAILATYRVTLLPPKLESKSFEVGAASMEYLVDAGRQAYGDTTLPIEPLSARAAVFAELMASQPVLSRIASEAGIPPGAITATGPIQTNEGDQGANTDDPNARLNELSAEGAPYRVSFSSQEDVPIVSIFAQAPSAEEAARMATASSTVFRDYLAAVQRTDNIPESQQVVIRPLGQATGGIVRGGEVGPAVAALAFLLTFGGLCVLILLVTGATGRWREQRASEEIGAPGATNGEQPTPRIIASQGSTPTTAEKRAAER